jgi:hypothetical protein
LLSDLSRSLATFVLRLGAGLPGGVRRHGSVKTKHIDIEVERQRA